MSCAYTCDVALQFECLSGSKIFVGVFWGMCSDWTGVTPVVSQMFFLEHMHTLKLCTCSHGFRVRIVPAETRVREPDFFVFHRLTVFVRL